MKLRIDKRKLKYVGIVLLALIGSFMFHVDRSDNMDFNRYQTIMDSLRSSGISWLDYMVNCNAATLRANAIMQYSYAFNTLMYLVAKLFENNYILVWISVLFDYSLIAYIAFDWKRNSKYKTNEVILVLLACFSLLPGVPPKMATSPPLWLNYTTFVYWVQYTCCTYIGYDIWHLCLLIYRGRYSIIHNVKRERAPGARHAVEIDETAAVPGQHLRHEP